MHLRVMKFTRRQEIFDEIMRHTKAVQFSPDFRRECKAVYIYITTITTKYTYTLIYLAITPLSIY